MSPRFGAAFGVHETGMALLTPMTLDEARAHGRAYGLSIVALDPIAAGSVNSNFGARCEDGTRVFLRVCEESSAAEVKTQNALLVHLVAGGVATPPPLCDAQGDSVREHAGRPLVAFPYVPGEMVCQKSVTPKHAARIGQALARIHGAGATARDVPASRFGVAALEARLADLDDAALPADVAATVARARDALAHAPSLPSAHVIHGDVFRDNVLWRGDELAAVLDFESASRGDAMFDLAVALLAWCFGDDLDAGLARAMVAAYGAAREVAAADRARLYDAARLAALRFVVTRITDYELRPRGVVVYKDFRRFVARLDAIEGFGPDGVAAWWR